MKKLMFLVMVLMLSMATVSVSAVENDVVKAGLRYGSDAVYSANAQIVSGTADGFYFGYYDEDRSFVELGYTDEQSVCTTADSNIPYNGSEIASSGSKVLGGWHVQLEEWYDNFYDAQEAAYAYDDAYVAFVDGEYFVRVGSYADASDAESMAWELGGEVVGPSRTGVTVTARGEKRILFQFDYSGYYNFALLADDEDSQTWFQGKKYYGAFEYPRVSGGDLYVISVADVESYLKGVVPYEMHDSWPEEALKAQAVCARTYVMRVGARHSSYGFDVCTSEHCQVYHGVDYQYKNHTYVSDAAVDDTAGICMYYNGAYVYAVYSASNGGASEDVKNVWGSNYPYLKGKEDPYETSIASSIGGYHYSVKYTAASLGSRMASRYSNYKLSTLTDVYVSEFTPSGNVYEVTFVDKNGKTYTVTGETCRLALGTKSQRFTINGDSGNEFHISGGETISSVAGSYIISGSGEVDVFDGDVYVITAEGVEELGAEKGGNDISDGILIEGTGNGHNVGMSQWGANAMAKEGFDFMDILNFYFTGITIE